MGIKERPLLRRHWVFLSSFLFARLTTFEYILGKVILCLRCSLSKNLSLWSTRVFSLVEGSQEEQVWGIRTFGLQTLHSTLFDL